MIPQPKRPGTAAPPRASTLRLEDFEYVRRLVLEEKAIVLEGAGGDLDEDRLDALAIREGFASAADLVARLRQDRPGGLRSRAVEALTREETMFFRDPRAFDHARRSLLPELIARKAPGRPLKIWSAGCSGGQEPYSLAMLALEHSADLAEGGLSILASDLSAESLERARRGRYTQAEVNRGLPTSLLIKYFRREGLEWIVSEAVRRPVEFRPIDLVAPWPSPGEFDLIVLRDVLPDLEPDARRAILGRIAGVLVPDGYLWLGASEGSTDLDDRFERLEPERGSFYRPRGCRPSEVGLPKGSG